MKCRANKMSRNWEVALLNGIESDIGYYHPLGTEPHHVFFTLIIILNSGRRRGENGRSVDVTIIKVDIIKSY